MSEAQREEVVAVLSPEAQLREAEELVRNRVYWSLGIGLVPIPLVDFAGLMAVQLDMLARLAKIYGVPFRKDMGKNIISTLVGSAVPALTAAPLASMLKFIPVIGYTTGAVSMSLVGGACTYALGKVFTKHFALGGTLFDLDLECAKKDFKAEYETGKAKAAEAKGQA